MFSSEYGEAIVEVLDILNNTKKEDVDKIPTSFMEFLVKNSARNYSVKFDHTKPLNELNLMQKTRDILGVIYINWWCGNEEYEQYMTQIRENREKPEVVENVVEPEPFVHRSENISTKIETDTSAYIVENIIENTSTSAEPIVEEIATPTIIEESKPEENKVDETWKENKIEETTKTIENETTSVAPIEENSSENKMLMVVNEKKGFFQTIFSKISNLFRRQKVEVKN